MRLSGTTVWRLGLIQSASALLLASCCLQVVSDERASTGTMGTTTAGCAFRGKSSTGPGVTTLAGNGAFQDADGTGGPNGTAEFSEPSGLAISLDCNLYVADGIGLRRIDAEGNVTTIVGYQTAPSGSNVSMFPIALATDSAGNTYIADTSKNRICRLDLAGHLTTFAGNGDAGFADGTAGETGTAEFNQPTGVGVDSTGDVFVADSLNNRVRKIDAAGHVTTVAGNGQQGRQDGTGGTSGSAEFNDPWAIAVAPDGTLYVTDNRNGRVCRIDANGNVTTVAGGPLPPPGGGAFADGTGGPAGPARFAHPTGLALLDGGPLYVADAGNNRIRQIDPLGNVTTLAGNGTTGFADGTLGPSGTAEFNQPSGVAVDGAGYVYVADTFNHRIRTIVP